MGVVRSNLVERLKLSVPREPRSQADDEWLLPKRTRCRARQLCEYRRVTVLLNCQLEGEGRPRANHKRIYRIMRINQLALPGYDGRRERLMTV